MPCLDIRCPLPYPEATGAAIQVSQPCYLCPWYVSNMQFDEDLAFSLFADHIRALTASFNSKLTAVENPLLRQLSGYLY